MSNSAEQVDLWWEVTSCSSGGVDKVRGWREEARSYLYDRCLKCRRTCFTYYQTEFQFCVCENLTVELQSSKLCSTSSSHSWRFPPRTLSGTSWKDPPYCWSPSSTKTTTGPSSRRRVTLERCWKDLPQVSDAVVSTDSGDEWSLTGIWPSDTGCTWCSGILTRVLGKTGA